MEKVRTHLRKAKTWNIVLLVINGLSLAMALYGLPNTLKPKLESYAITGIDNALAQQMYDQANSFGTKSIAIFSLVLSVVIIVLQVLGHRKLKVEQPASKLPYYLLLVWIVISIVYSFIATPKMIVEGIDITSFTLIIGAVFQLILAIPAIIVLVHLFKADTGE